MKKLLIIALIISCVYAINYKYVSTVPIEVVNLSNINVNELEKYLNDNRLTLLILDERTKKDIIKALNITISPDKIPDYDNYTLITNSNCIVYPKKYVYYDDDGALIYIPPANISSKSINYTKISDGVYEIKKNKLLFLYPTDLNDKKTLDILGRYIAKNNGTFAYINKAPAGYDNILVAGVGVSKVIPDENGKYCIKVAKRKIKVNYLDDEVINKKIKAIKLLSAFGINVSYIVSGDEAIKLIEKSNLNKEDLKLINQYWFKSYKNYTHTYINPEKLNYDLDIVALSYYPLIYVDKSPETFENDPTVGGYYPTLINYESGYWQLGEISENRYYYLYKGEPYWNGKANEVSKWYYKGEPVPEKENNKMNDRYKYFNHWFVKNYGYALASGCNGLFLESSNEDLVNAVLGKDGDWKLDINGKVKYLIIPGKRGFEIYNGIPILKVPTPLSEVYGVNILNITYIPPEDEEFGVYIADIRHFNTNLLFKLKNEGTCIMNFNQMVNWLKDYYENNIHLINKSIIIVKNPKNVKITLYTNKQILGNFKHLIKNNGSYIIECPKVIILR
ncbi:hypothetical protein J422_01233 [Methanocaldococcus villosus KIN24-T80]|uniref:Uncharacterized protein n=1 Tax=Methanocaldococcus villosus KIN24-T80 TaxID=1069083 RepID=N6VZW1_9EURY|nr:hypothetical protein [Methanocaldococcus villosus]ENN96622.1 hypothetical protein J422_01233 [Methanocaldococcus villosus KIN24-T80]